MGPSVDVRVLARKQREHSEGMAKGILQRWSQGAGELAEAAEALPGQIQYIRLSQGGPCLKGPGEGVGPKTQCELSSGSGAVASGEGKSFTALQPHGGGCSGGGKLPDIFPRPLCGLPPVPLHWLNPVRDQGSGGPEM